MQKEIMNTQRISILNIPTKVTNKSDSYVLVSKKAHPESSVVSVGNVKIGGSEPVIIAGPCAIESREQLLQAARTVKKSGAHLLRGGVYKPRTSPYSFQGLEQEGLRILAEVKEETGLPVVSEVTSPEAIAQSMDFVDMFQIGARNMQNFFLLKEAGRSKKPVLLKRGLAATIEEWLYAAEYIIAEGNPDVVLCERGIRTFETATRNTLDLSAVPVIHAKSHLPILIDPSHATGVRDYVEPLALAAIAAGANGIMIECHPDPAEALSDGPQSLTLPQFDQLCKKVFSLSGMIKEL